METAPNPQTILFVEDEAFLRMHSVEMLEAAGFRVLEAQNGSEALEILANRGDVSVLVTDVRMPGPMDGLDLVAQVRRDNPALPSIVVSGTTSADDAYGAGARDFIPKPYFDDIMLGAIRRAILQTRM